MKSLLISLMATALVWEIRLFSREHLRKVLTYDISPLIEYVGRKEAGLINDSDVLNTERSHKKRLSFSACQL